MINLDEELQRVESVCRHGRQLLNARGRISQENADRCFTKLVNSLDVLEKEVNNADCSTVMKQHLLSRINVMVTLRKRVEDATRTEVVVAGLEQLPQRVQYHKVETAFQRRLRTGVISNLRHLELSVFVREIQRVLQTENTVRVYVLLKSDYMKAGDDDADTKSFNTKSADIFTSKDLREWFNEHVRVPLLRDVGVSGSWFGVDSAQRPEFNVAYQQVQSYKS